MTNAGFTQNDTAIRPVIEFGEFSYENIHVQKAKQDPESLLNWMITMIELYKDLPERSYGQWEILDTGSKEALANIPGIRRNINNS